MTDVKGTVAPIISIKGTVQTTEISGRLAPQGKVGGVVDQQGEVSGTLRGQLSVNGVIAEITNFRGDDVASGFVYFTDVTVPGGTASGKTYQDPSNTVIQTATVSSLDVRLSIRASYPKVNILGTDYFLSRVPGESHYAGDIDVTVSEGDTVVTLQTPDDAAGAVDTVTLTLSAPPTITALSFTGGYPGSQTELKEDDSFDIVVTADKQFDQVVIVDYEACKSDTIGVAATLSTTVTATIADRGTAAVLRPARVYVRDATTGAFSPTRDTNTGGGSVDGTDVVNCNNLFPSVSVGAVTYPGVQQALKGSENATVVNTVSNFDTVSYNSPNGDLSVTNPTTFENPKTVARVSGTYNVGTINFRITANRAANNATTIDTGIVNIAAVAAVASVSFPGARVRSGDGSGQDTTITLSFDQQMQNASMDPAAGRGTFQGSWSGGPTSFTRDLRVTDAENPTDNSSNSWTNVSATNLAGIVTNSITSGPTYVVGGFAPRTLNFAPFVADSTESFPLTTEGNLSAGVFSNGNTAVVQPFGTADTADVGKEGWCAPTAASGSVQMHMLHTPTVNANSGGLTLTLVEETA